MSIAFSSNFPNHLLLHRTCSKIPNIQVLSLSCAPSPTISSMFNLSRNTSKASPYKPLEPFIISVLKLY